MDVENEHGPHGPDVQQVAAWTHRIDEFLADRSWELHYFALQDLTIELIRLARKSHDLLTQHRERLLAMNEEGLTIL